MSFEHVEQEMPGGAIGEHVTDQWYSSFFGENVLLDRGRSGPLRRLVPQSLGRQQLAGVIIVEPVVVLQRVIAAGAVGDHFAHAEAGEDGQVLRGESGKSAA